MKKMKRTFEIGTGTFGSGRTKICVPIVAAEKEDIWKKTAEIALLDIDIVEWRADFFAQAADWKAMESVLPGLKERLKKKSLLFTFRTAREGGKQDVDKESYAGLLRCVAASGFAELIDVEIFWDTAFFSALLPELQADGAKVIASNHHFHETPSMEEMLRLLHQMEASGADVAKLAVMPKTRQDVLTLLQATLTADEQLQIPVVTMSMGSLGVLSRLSGRLTGSAMTFASLGEASAPGQIEVSHLLEFLKVIENQAE